MKNQTIKSHGGFQNYIDYVIKFSDFADYTENGVKKEEETHIDVDVILAEPIPVSKRHKIQATNSMHPANHKASHSHNHAHTLMHPKREKLIMNLHEPVKTIKRTRISSGVMGLIFSY